MKKKILHKLISAFLVLCIATSAGLAVSAAYPTHTAHIYDGSDVISDSLSDTIKSTNDSLFDKVNARLFVCVVESLGGEPIHTYARNLYTKWELCDGILLLVSTGDQNYYAVQSQNISKYISNQDLADILKEFMEPDFAEGNIEKGIQKTINKFASFMKSALPAVGASDKAEKSGEQSDSPVTLGSIILSVLKILGLTVLVFVGIFVILFIAALFNDKAAELLNRLVFSRFRKKKAAPKNRNYYDERLYGNPQNAQKQPRNGPPNSRQPKQGQNGRPMYDRYHQGGVRYDDEYYGNRRTQQKNTQSSPTRNRPAPRKDNPDYGNTRQFTIDDRK